MAINTSINPYYDDFNPDDHYHRILFKPGYAVQARELTQMQSILQDQVTKFGNHIFQQNSPVSGGQITTNINVFAIKLETVDRNNEEITAKDFENLTITDISNKVVAKVLTTSEAEVDDVGNVVSPPLLIVTYSSGVKFSAGQTVYIRGQSSGITAQIISNSSSFSPYTNLASICSISEGVFYVNGIFVGVDYQTVILDKNSNTPSISAGLKVEELIVTSDEDFNLLDPAIGASNYQAPGADRYKINLNLSTRPLESNEEMDFIEMVRYVNGQIVKITNRTIYSEIDDYFAMRTYDTNGDFVSEKFNITTDHHETDSKKFYLTVGPGRAYVRGYVVENQSPLKLEVNKARTFANVRNAGIYMNYGNYINLEQFRGFFDSGSLQSVDIHASANVSNSSIASYNSTLAATARIRALEFVSGNPANTKSFVYRGYLFDIENKTLDVTSVSTFSNATTTLAKTYVQLPSTFSVDPGAYVGVKGEIIGAVGLSAENTPYINRNFTIVDYTGGSSKLAGIVFDIPLEEYINYTMIFKMRFDTKDYESIIANNCTATYYTNSLFNFAKISNLSKDTGFESGKTLISDKGDEEIVYKIGRDYIKEGSLLDYTTSSDYNSYQSFRDVPINSVLVIPQGASDSINYIGAGLLDANDLAENFIITVTDNAGSGLVSVGDILADSSKVTITISVDKRTATMSSATLPAGVKVSVRAKVWVKEAKDNIHILKSKNLVYGNTKTAYINGTTVISNIKVQESAGHIYIPKASFNTAKQSLYISDVKRIVKIIDSLSSGTAVTSAMISNPTYDVTRYYKLDTGARDGYYGHASITLADGAPPPKGNILVIVDYYDHVGGDGYFSVDSYLSPLSTSPEVYENIPSYTSKSGIAYKLRDSLDFRPRIKNAQPNFVIDSNNTDVNATNAGYYIPVDQSNFETNYGYYLGRRDIVVVSKNKDIRVIEGVPSLNPNFPKIPDGCIAIMKLTHEPYTTYIPKNSFGVATTSLSMEYLNHKRWRMEDITTLEGRVERLEYYTSLNNLENSAKNLQIPDELGINRFKNGIMTDDFSSTRVAETNNSDYYCAIDQTQRQLKTLEKVRNFPFHLKDTLHNNGRIEQATKSAFTYTPHVVGGSTYVTLPYNKFSLISQPFASRVVNLNPFNFIPAEGVCNINPNMDNWISNETLPDINIQGAELGIFQGYSNDINSVIGFGDWKVVGSVEDKDVTIKGTLDKYVQSSFGGAEAIWNITEDEIYSFISAWGNTAYSGTTLKGKTKSGQTQAIIEQYFDSNEVPMPPYSTPGKYNNVNGQSYVAWLRVMLSGFITTTSAGTTGAIGYIADYDKVTTITKETTLQRDVIYDLKNKVGSITTNGFLTDVKMNPYIRAQEIEFTADGLLSDCNVAAFFDGVDVSDRVRENNVLEVEHVYNSVTNGPTDFFTEEAILGYYPVGKLTPTPFAKVVKCLVTSISGTGTYKIANLKLTISWDISAPSFTNKNNPLFCDITAIFFGVNNTIVPTNAKANVINIITNSGAIRYFDVDTQKLYVQGSINISQIQNLINSKKSVNIILEDYNLFVSFKDVGTDSNGTYIHCNTKIPAITKGIYTFKPEANIEYDTGYGSGYTGYLKTDESGFISGTFYLPAGRFYTGEKKFRIDNRIAGNEGSELTYAENTFFATSLSTKSQALSFGPMPPHKTFKKTETDVETEIEETKVNVKSKKYFRYDPVCQTFILWNAAEPRGGFIKSVKLFFKLKPTTELQPVTVKLLETLNGYPTGNIIPNSEVTLTADKIKISDNPHILDPNTYTVFEFPVPIYIKPETLFALMVQSFSNEYFIYTAKLGDYKLESTNKVLPTDPDKTVPEKLSTSPYIGSLFLSQNTITWQADQNQQLMFDFEFCNFDTTKKPTIEFVIPYRLPERRLVDNTLTYLDNPVGYESPMSGVINYQDLPFDIANFTTTDFTFDVAPITYGIAATTLSGLNKDDNLTPVNPGRFGTASLEDIYFDDGKGERVLVANSNNSFSLFATLSSTNRRLSPVLCDAGLSLYAVKNVVNNLPLNNYNFVVIDGGSGYSSSPVVEITCDGYGAGQGALVSANVVGGEIDKINVISGGFGYANTSNAKVVITDGTGNNASVVIVGESSKRGGNAWHRYISKPTTLAEGFDAGDLRVYYTAYRPTGTSVYIYYKILNRDDRQRFADSDWQLMTTISGDNLYSKSRTNLYEYVAAPGAFGKEDNKVIYSSKYNGVSYKTFYQFAIKVVYSTPDPTLVPYLTDLRVIALPEAIYNITVAK